MDELFGKLDGSISKSLWLPFIFSALLSLLLYRLAANKSQSFEMSGHKYHIVGVVESKIEGQSYYTPLFKED